MVYMYGGGFINGENTNTEYGPQYYLDQEQSLNLKCNSMEQDLLKSCLKEISQYKITPLKLHL